MESELSGIFWVKAVTKNIVLAHFIHMRVNLNVLKFELPYEWTPPQIFFCGYRVLQLLCHNVEGAHDIKFSKKLLELKFC